MRYKLQGVPDDLAPGTYATRVDSAVWEGNDLVVTLKFTGPLSGKFDCLFPITKRELDKEETQYTLAGDREVTLE